LASAGGPGASLARRVRARTLSRDDWKLPPVPEKQKLAWSLMHFATPILERLRDQGAADPKRALDGLVRRAQSHLALATLIQAGLLSVVLATVGSVEDKSKAWLPSSACVGAGISLTYLLVSVLRLAEALKLRRVCKATAATSPARPDSGEGGRKSARGEGATGAHPAAGSGMGGIGMGGIPADLITELATRRVPAGARMAALRKRLMEEEDGEGATELVSIEEIEEESAVAVRSAGVAKREMRAEAERSAARSADGAEVEMAELGHAPTATGTAREAPAGALSP
jgi:hypothetical protein